MHIYGKNIAGEPIDIYKNVLLVASPDDYDGDGVPNTSDTCTFIVSSGLDVDQDGVDDACDGEILEAPIVAPPILTDDTGDNSNHSHEEYYDGSGSHDNRHEGSEHRQDKEHKPKSTHQTGHKPDKQGKPRSKNGHKKSPQSWVRPVIIFLTTTPLGIGILILLRL